MSKREVLATSSVEPNVARYKIKFPVLSNLGDELILVLGLRSIVVHSGDPFGGAIYKYYELRNDR